MRDAYSCLLNVVMQALWHVTTFREAVLRCHGVDALLSALQASNHHGTQLGEP